MASHLATIAILVMLASPGARCLDIHMAAILPADPGRMFSIKHVAPAVEIAIENLQRYTDILGDNQLYVKYRDSKCSPDESMHHAINFYVEHRVHVFLGPVCDYAVAPVARQTRYWDIPLLTPGAVASDFSQDRTAYGLLTRVGQASTDKLSNALIQMFHLHRFGNVTIFYDTIGSGNAGIDRFCFLSASALNLRVLMDARNITLGVQAMQGQMYMPDFSKLEKEGDTLSPTAQSWSALATGGLSLFNFNMPLFYMPFTSAFIVAVVVD